MKYHVKPKMKEILKEGEPTKKTTKMKRSRYMYKILLKFKVFSQGNSFIYFFLISHARDYLIGTEYISSLHDYLQICISRTY